MTHASYSVKRVGRTRPNCGGEHDMKLVVAMTGATGAIFGVRLLEVLAKHDVETHLVMSRWARPTVTRETGLSVREVEDLATISYRPTTRAPRSPAARSRS